jgi:hypothetical protein
VIGTVVFYIRKKSRQGKKWNGPGSSFTASEDISDLEMDLSPSKCPVSFSNSVAGDKPGGLLGKKLVWGPKNSVGGFGEVYRGKYDGITYNFLHTGREITIKKMLTDVQSDNRIKFVENFVTEAKIMLTI